ncbi:uncharacterized protein LOC128161527 [Crassostrea angulata]|uniref:uncharacterized protein LOC128161527 n=1 Tax=Magallana angulata TaxID=2784310 RepID=UPI0022B16657|nr:uncharacterized protein LOC128161527 [Crassostrea angulata]
MAMLPLSVVFLTAGSICHAQSTIRYLQIREESLWKRKEAEHGHSIFKRGHDCPKDIYYCPDTSPLVMTPGNPSTGEELFRKGYFDDVCRYFPEFIECAKDFQDETNPSCEVGVRSSVALFSLREKNLCKSPMLPIAREIRQCLNSKVYQLEPLFGQVMDLIYKVKWDPENQESKETFCPPYEKVIEETIMELKTCDKYGFQWSDEKETILRNYYYPALSYLALPFQCDDL